MLPSSHTLPISITLKGIALLRPDMLTIGKSLAH
jgi:hypothetical protein